MKLSGIALVTVAALFTLLMRAEAHHSFSQFDQSTQKVISGTVARWDFNNPHVWLHIDVDNEDGSTSLWSFEGQGIMRLLPKNINGTTMVPGDPVTLLYCPLRDGRNGGALAWIRLDKNERFINPSDGGCRIQDEQIEQWKGWLEQGYMSNLEVEAAEG